MDKKAFKPKGLATAIGSMPQTDPVDACSAVLTHLTAIPAWPQLPYRSFLENMYVQYSERFPSVVIEHENERIYVDRSADLTGQLEKLYEAYLGDNLDEYAISPEYAAGLHQFLSQKMDSAIAVKGQVTGPISFGLAVLDQDRRPILYDETLADAIAKHLRLKAAWMERELMKLSPNTIIFIDEPYLASLGSAFVALSNDTVINLTNEVLGGLSGLTGIHCCGNTDWSVLMASDIDILNFDTFNFGESLALYPDDLRTFLNRGGIIAWGIVSNVEEKMAQETPEKTVNRLDDLFKLLKSKGIPHDLLLEQCLITPSCSLASMSPEASNRAMKLTTDTSNQFRHRYGLEGN